MLASHSTTSLTFAIPLLSSSIRSEQLSALMQTKGALLEACTPTAAVQLVESRSAALALSSCRQACLADALCPP